MTEFKDKKSPGVYIKEPAAFPLSVIGVQTAIPAFIGYTERAEISGKPVFLQPIKVGSMAEFEEIFGGRFKSIYDIVQQNNQQDNNYDFRVLWGNSSPPSPISSSPDSYHYFCLQQASTSGFNLYDGMRLFYTNGGGNCYVVSVGTYDDGQQVREADLLAGLNVIKEQAGATMLVIPDAVLLPADVSEGDGVESDQPPYYKPYHTSQAFQNVTRAMLAQCMELQDRVAILDVYSTLSVGDQASLDKVVNQFRLDVGSEALSYGVAYFPFLHTSVVPLSDFDYSNIGTSSQALLQEILNRENYRLYYSSDQGQYKQISDTIKNMFDSGTNVTSTNQNLSTALPLLAQIEQAMVGRESVLPPGAAMAGVYTYVDGTSGVWNAPANITLNAVDRTTYQLTDQQQVDLNAPLDGKAVNSIREFVGRGSVVWGSRTLDGNSDDWRYIQARRTIIYIDQSIKLALDQFTWAPNEGSTWVTVISMISSFLTNLSSQGGLVGLTASDAFTVQCGLGSTMTGLDIRNGYMIVQVTLQMLHPAEFIELTFKQKMEGVG